MSDLSKLQSAEPVLITDGSNLTWITTSQPTGGASGLVTRNASDYIYTVAFTSTLSLSANATVPLGYIWHPNTDTDDYYLQKITVSFMGGSGTSGAFLKLCRITAQPITPGGTVLTPQRYDNDAPASSSIVRSFNTGTPTRDSADLMARAITTNISDVWTIEFPNAPRARSSVNEGWELRFENGTVAANGLRLAVELVWIEV